MDKITLQKICISPDTTLKGAIQCLNATARKIVCVADEERKLLGTVSDGDVRRALLKGYGFEESVERIMARNYHAIDSNEHNIMDHAKMLMKEYQVSHIPVLDDAHRLIDIVAWTDFLENGQERTISHPPRNNMVVIMAGGKGTRLNPFTDIFPKPLMPIGDTPAIEVIMERFSRSGFNRFCYTLNYKKEYVKLFLKEKTFPYEIDWVEEDTFLGTAGSLGLLQERVKDTFFVANCDTFLSIDFHEVLDWHKECGALITVVGSHSEINIPFGVLTLSNGKLEGIREKPVHDVIINTGMYVMEPRVLDYITSGATLDMNELINTVAQNEKVNVYPVYGKDWIDIGRWEEYNKGIQYLQGQS